MFADLFSLSTLSYFVTFVLGGGGGMYLHSKFPVFGAAVDADAAKLQKAVTAKVKELKDAKAKADFDTKVAQAAKDAMAAAPAK